MDLTTAHKMCYKFTMAALHAPTLTDDPRFMAEWERVEETRVALERLMRR